LPHAPQCAGLVCRFTQTPPQFVCSAVQLTTHPPFLQACPAAHVLPHAPQLRGSLVTVTQAPLQSICPEGQEHAPETQLFAPEQLRPH
jgi:hypothetical protein